MTICLQGGAEFGPSCREMDKAVLRRARGRPVLVLPLGHAPGEDYEAVGQQALEWYRELAVDDVSLVADPRADESAAARTREQAGAAAVLVLPGGSVAGLLQGLRETGLDEVLRRRQAEGAIVLGTTAGAMVLCEWTVVDTDAAPTLVRGLGLIPSTLVLPHYTSGLRPDWLSDVPADVTVLGLPDCSGVLVDDDAVTALGGSRTRLVSGGRTVAVLDPGATRDAWWVEAAL